MSLVEKVTEAQKAAFGAFRDLPEGAWVAERLVVDNFILDPVPTRMPQSDVPLTEFERGVCEGRRVLALEILELFQMSIQDAYEVINRVERMARGEAGDIPFASS